jgi:ElaB/YqjD/DUF883 family membrane-anchored ribosome-binding protein
MNEIDNTTTLAGGEASSRFGSRPPGADSTLGNFKNKIAEKLQAAAEEIQDKSRQNPGSPVAAYAGPAVGFLEDAADYVRQVDPEQIKTDLKTRVRRNPGKSLLIAGAVGLLFGVLVRR